MMRSNYEQGYRRRRSSNSFASTIDSVVRTARTLFGDDRYSETDQRQNSRRNSHRFGSLAHIYRTSRGTYEDTAGCQYRVFVDDSFADDRGRHDNVPVRDLGHVYRTSRGTLEDSHGRRYRVFYNDENVYHRSRANDPHHRAHHESSESSISSFGSRDSESGMDYDDNIMPFLVERPSARLGTISMSSNTSYTSSESFRSTTSRYLGAGSDAAAEPSGDVERGRPQEQLLGLLRGVRQPENAGARPTHGRLLVYLTDRGLPQLPSNVEYSADYSSLAGNLQLISILYQHFPNGTPPNRTLVIIDRADENNSNEPRVLVFDDDGAFALSGENVLPIFQNAAIARGRPFLDEVTMIYLISLIDRTGIIPRVLIRNLDWIASQQSSDTNDGVSENTVAGLRTRLIAIEDLDVQGKACCSICLDEKQVGETVTVLPCNHYFDKDCVGEWLRQHGTCPVCRRVVEERIEDLEMTDV